MQSHKLARWGTAGRRSTGPMLVLMGLALVLSGCITAAVATTIIVVAGTMQYTATVEVSAPPDKVYAAMLRILERRPDVTVKDRDDEHRHLEVSKGKNTAKAEVKLAKSGLTELTVTARENETDMSHKELALKVVQQVCDELGVKYQVVEKKKLIGG